MKKNKLKEHISIIFIIAGLLLILIKGFTPEYIDKNGLLHEHFFLLPIGFLFVFVGIILFIIKKTSK